MLKPFNPTLLCERHRVVLTGLTPKQLSVQCTSNVCKETSSHCAKRQLLHSGFFLIVCFYSLFTLFPPANSSDWTYKMNKFHSIWLPAICKKATWPYVWALYSGLYTMQGAIQVLCFNFFMSLYFSAVHHTLMSVQNITAPRPNLLSTYGWRPMSVRTTRNVRILSVNQWNNFYTLCV